MEAPSGVGTSAREWWSALTSEWGRWVISWRIWAGVAVTRVLTASVLFSARYEMGSIRSIGLVVLAYCIAGLVMVAAGATVLRDRRIRPPRPTVVIVVWLLSGLTYALTLHLTLPPVQGGDSTSLANGVVAPTLLFVAKQAILVAVVTSLLAGTRHAQELRQTIQRQEELVAQTEPYITELRERNLEALRTLQPAFARLRAEVDDYLRAGPDDTLSGLPGRLASFGRGEVRDLSHRVAAGEFGASINRTISTAPSTGAIALSVLRSSLTYAPYALFTAAWFVVMVVAWTPSLTARDLRVALLECLVIIVQLTLARLSLDRLPRSEQSARLAIVLITCLATIASVMLVHGFSDSSQGKGLTFMEIVTAVIGSLLLTGVYRQQRLALLQLEEASAALSAQLQHLRRESERIRHRIAQILHGTVQGRLALAAVRVSELRTITELEAREAAHEEIIALLASIEDEFRSAESIVTEPETVDDLEASLALLSREWAGLLECEWTIDADARDALAARPLLTREVTDIITEAVLNARRHGDATSVTAEVAIARPSPLSLRITVTDDGHGPEGDSRPGLGHSTLASLGARWALVRDDHSRTVLVVVLLAPREAPQRPPHAVKTDKGVTRPVEPMRA